MPAPIESNRTLLEKADLVLADLVSDGGYLTTEVSKKFLKIAIDKSAILGMALVETTKSHTKRIDRIGLTSPMLVPGYEGTSVAAADRTQPALDDPTITTHLFKGEIQLTDESLEDNIEGQSLKSTVMNMIGERVGLDMGDIVLNGDTVSATARYSLFDGIRKLATANTVAAGGVPLDKNVLRDMMKTLPSQYMADKRRMKFVTGIDGEIDYRDGLSDRATALGDMYLDQDRRAAYNGIEVVAESKMPEDLGGGTNETEVIFCDPKNWRVGIWRKVKIETDRDIRRGVLFTVVSTRFGFIYEDNQAVVKATGVTVS